MTNLLMTIARFEGDLSGSAVSDLPPAKVGFSVALERDKPWQVRVQAGRIEVTGRGESVKHKAFDDGMVVVDFDDKDRVVAIELLAGLRLDQLPEFKAFAEKSNDRVTGAAARAIVRMWPFIHNTFTAFLKSIRQIMKTVSAAQVPAVHKAAQQAVQTAFHEHLETAMV